MPLERETKETIRTVVLKNIPPYTILLWPKDRPVPPGFQDCDGTNGTVNIPIQVGGVAKYIQKLVAKVLLP